MSGPYGWSCGLSSIFRLRAAHADEQELSDPRSWSCIWIDLGRSQKTDKYFGYRAASAAILKGIVNHKRDRKTPCSLSSHHQLCRPPAHIMLQHPPFPCGIYGSSRLSTYSQKSVRVLAMSADEEVASSGEETYRAPKRWHHKVLCLVAVLYQTKEAVSHLSRTRRKQ